MRSAKSVRRQTKFTYSNKPQNTYLSFKKSIKAQKEWQVGTYTEDPRLLNKPVAFNPDGKSIVYTNPQPKTAAPVVEKKTAPVKKVVPEKKTAPVKKTQKVQEKVATKQSVQQPLSVDVNTNVGNKGMKSSVDSGVDVNVNGQVSASSSHGSEHTHTPEHERSPVQTESFLASVNSLVQKVLGTTKHEPKTFPPLNINHAVKRERTHKLQPRDIKFCATMLEKFGEDFESMSKSKENIFMDTPSGIKRKIRIFKESPQYEAYTKGKAEGKTIEEIVC
uniref:Nucleolar protein 16 n=1 Tax=Rhabditophanes sp. KR3021 TaxID=114890 RepID=A0AC35U5U4_9BILA